ncbi:MAG: FABP family protein [Mycobacterium sp.]|nr:FABP family protein [Mycobacterium sp.]
MPEIHPEIAPLAALLGTWSGRGVGDYPTIEPFEYLEDVTIGHVGKPFLSYTQRTRSEDGRPMHAETGYIRMPAPGRVELVVAHPTGVTEIDEGTVTDDGGLLVIDVESTCIGLTTSAKPVAALQRWIRVADDELHYNLQMGAVGQSLQHHLTATLFRQP